MNIYERAIDWLECVGWTQGVDVDSQGRCCILGSLWLMSKSDEEYFGACDEMWEWMQGSMIEWNDIPGRTKEEVITFLQLCAKS